MILNRIGFINRMPIRLKVSLTVVFILALIIGLLTTYGLKREKYRMVEGVKKEVIDLTTMYFDGLNTMMLTGTMDKRDIFRKKMLSREGIVEARPIRGNPVSDQFGPGFSEDVPVDDLDRRALTGEDVSMIARKDGRRVLTVITPFKATENTRGVNCLKCHNVKSGDVNGAVRISYSLAALDDEINREIWKAVIVNAAFFVVGLFLVNLLLKTWVINPLNSLMDAVTRRSKGDLKVRAASISTYDELGKLAAAFNEMSDTTDEAAAREKERTAREHAAAVELSAKVNELLRVVNRVAEGDLGARVNFTGEDSIGELAAQLQNMIDRICKSSEEKRQAMEFLQQRVNTIIDVVTKAAEGDLTGRLEIKGDDAIVQLGTGIQRMIANLNAFVTQVQRSGIQLASAVTSIAATSKQQEATVAEQAATTNEIVATATEISATSKDLVSTMDEVSGVAESTAKSAESGRSGLNRMESTMNHIVEAARTISSKFEVLNEKAGNINTVVTTITKVADQTNLLSLNAAIEAEKAGEYGFGFSVVAKEIRRLADQTAVATLDIEQMVKEMQTAVSAGVMSMEKFSQQVRQSVSDVREISSQLSLIIGQVQNLTPLFESVHQGMQSQSAGASQINQAMIQLSEAAQQTVASLKESNEVIMQLNVAARELQSGVTRFKVRKDS